MSNAVKIERVGSVAVCTFTNPAERNPLSRSVLTEIHTLLDTQLDADAAGLIFTGSGRTFASGANLKEISALSRDGAREFAELGQGLMKKISGLALPTVAAIDGHCFGGALDLALACGRRIASARSQFAHPGAGLGIITGWGGTQRLPRLIGRANALEMFFTAAPIDAARALNFGLIDSIDEVPLSKAVDLIAGDD